MTLQRGDIVVWTTCTAQLLRETYFYVADDKQYGGDRKRVKVYQVSQPGSWCVGFSEDELKVVGHVDPDQVGETTNAREEGFIPTVALQGVLAPWTGRYQPES
jgi:hypothetical protein